MDEPTFRAQFKDIWIELHRTMLKSFVHKLLAANYRLTWRHEDNGIELIIHCGEDRMSLPMHLENERKTIVNIKELEVIKEELAFCLEDLITESKGSAIVRTITDGGNYVSYFDHGKVVSVLKTSGGRENLMDAYHQPVQIKSNLPLELDATIRAYVISSEIDYFLMELKEAMENNDDIAKNRLKDRLRKLVNEKEKFSHQQ
ncbi:hypothetical protein [Salipaludibacillus daqingensis]|uniref:hypothetical protein n=1 Tax=Salipaludibacillus daqingensis TaxID=3041001 RepID=UPI002475FD96|nr:hypothetical protein [Salipaludibacillus daqingensis]